MDGSIPSDLEDHVRELLGKRADASFRRLVRYEVKADKYEQRILVLTDYRLYILTAKIPAKVEHSVHYLDVTCMESRKPTQVVFLTSESKRLSVTVSEKDADDVIKYVTSQLRRAFPTTMPDDIIRLDIAPADRQRSLSVQPRESLLRDVGPCGGFSAIYEAMCDYYHLPYLDEVAWDVDTIYLSQDAKELRLSDFDHLGIKHLVPIIGALQYDSWFTSLNANNVRLTTEAANEVLRVMRKNRHLEELHLRNVGAKWEFAHKLAMALLHNTKSPLTVLDLSENPIEDRGIIHISGSLRQFHRPQPTSSRLNHLCSPISKLQRGLRHLNLARTGITAKGINRLADSLCANKVVTTSLTLLDLSDNALKGEDITNLYNFWARPNAITTLRLSGTECALENVFGALLPGCCGHLTHLDLSHNVFSHRKAKDVPPAWKQFFASAQALRVINLSDSKLTPEALKHVLLGISSNLDMKDVDLDVSSNHLRAAGADILQMTLPEIRNIATLNLSDNAFDNDMIGICNKMIQCHSIKKLYIGRNFTNIKPKYMGQVLDSVVQMIQDEESTIESLSLADSRLKTDTTVITNALGSNSSLTDIDLSGNLMGDVGARMLAKALQINTKLHTIYWDRNGTTSIGFSDIAQGLTKNYSVKKMPSPVNDAAVALRLNADKTEQALQKIEEVLKRNHSPRKLASDQGYRLHQGFLISSSQQMLDRLVVQVQEHITALEQGSRNLTEDAKTDIRTAQRIIADANATKQLLPKLQQVAVRVEHEGNLIDTKLASVNQDLHSATQRQLKRTVADMMKCVSAQCPTVTADTEFALNLQTTGTDKSALPTAFTRTLLIDHVGADLMNKVSELNLAVAAHMSDRLIDGVLDSLDACQKKLTNHINSADSVTGSAPTEKARKPPRPETLPSAANKARPTTGIDDDVFDEAAAQSTIKRKSLYSRRLRPQSVIDAADVKKALKMTEIDISNGGQGQLKEEEHENEAPKADQGTTGDAHSTVGVVVDSAVGEVEGDEGGRVTNSVLDDSRAMLKAPHVRMTLNSSNEEPCIDPDQDSNVKAEQEGQSEGQADLEVKQDPWVKVDKADVLEMDTEVKVESQMKIETEVKVEPEVKIPEGEVRDPVNEVKAASESEVKAADSEAGPEPVMRVKPRLRGEAVVRPESKVASRMNAGFLAELAAGIGAGRKEKAPRRPEGDEGESKPDSDETDGSRESKELSPIPQSPGTPKSPSLSLRSASSTSDISLPPLEELPKLEHLGKSRPRRNKTRAVSRAALHSDRSIEDIKEVSSGIDEFFERREVSREYVEPLTEDREKEKGDEEKRDDSKKKSWSPFSSQGNAKGLAAGISNFFSRRDKPSPTRSPEPGRRVSEEEPATRSPEPTRRTAHKSPTPERRRTRTDSDRESSPVPEEEPKKKEEEEVAPPWRRSVVGLPTLPLGSAAGGVGSTSGGASAILAEMRAKRASMKPPSPTGTKGDDKENKENNKEINRSSILPPAKENRNSIHPPASTKERSSGTPASALRPTSGQSATRPIPAPRANSPATSSEKSAEKSEELSSSPPGRPRSSILSKPRPPPIAPKPRAKTTGVPSSAKPTIITTPRTSDGPAPRVRSLYGGEGIKKDEAAGTTGALAGRTRADKPSDSDDTQDTHNGAAKKEGEFELFL